MHMCVFFLIFWLSFYDKYRLLYIDTRTHSTVNGNIATD